jgi:hypothetical protein
LKGYKVQTGNALPAGLFESDILEKIPFTELAHELGESLVVQRDTREPHVLVGLHLDGIEPDLFGRHGFDKAVEVMQRARLLLSDILDDRYFAFDFL